MGHGVLRMAVSRRARAWAVGAALILGSGWALADTAVSDQAAPSASIPPFPAMPRILEDYRGLRAGSRYDVSVAGLKVGRMRLNFASGTFTSILTRSGSETGFMFEGNGTYTYAIDDPADQQTTLKNIQSSTAAVTLRGGALSDEMRGCIFIASGPILDDILGPEAKSSGKPADTVSARLATFLTEAEDVGLGFDHIAAQGGLSAGAERILFGEIDGKSLQPGYLFDPKILAEERLFLYRTVLGNRIGVLVNRQDVDQGHAESPLRHTHIDYALDTDNNHDATLSITHTLAVTKPTGRVVPFFFRNHTDWSANTWKSSKWGIDVKAVRLGDGTSLPFSHRYHELLVELPEVPAAGAKIDLRFDVQLHSLDTRGDEFYLVSGGLGFPELVWSDAMNATSHWKVKTKKPYRSFTGGKVISRREEGDVMFLESEVETASTAPLLIAGKFTTKEFEKNGLKVRVSIYGTGSSRAFQSYSDAAFTLLDVYGKALVPYPRKELDVMEFKTLPFYVAPAGLVIVPSEPPTARTVAETRAADWHLRTFMHEIAHQWFGNMVSPQSQSDYWTSESVAEYLGALVYAMGTPDPKAQSQKLQFAVNRWRVEADMSRESVPISQAAYLRGDRQAGDAYTMLLYGKGPLVLRMLNKMMGDDPFFAMLQDVLKTYGGRSIDTAGFAKAASKAAGQDMSWFFEQWIEGTGIPDVHVSTAIVQEGGKTWLTGRLKQPDAGRLKKLVIPFLYEDGGRPGAKLVFMDRADQDFKVEIPSGVKSVSVDPGKTNLVYYH